MNFSEEEFSLPEAEVGDEIDDEIREAELRLAKAAYYREIAKNGVIQEDGTQEAEEINAEVKLWARQRMVVLLKSERAQPVIPQASSPFTPEQTEALIKLANRVMGPPTPDPAVKTIAPAPAPVAPTVKPIRPRAKKTPIDPKGVAPASSRTQKEKTPLRVKKSLETGEIDYDKIPTGEDFKDKDGVTYKFVQDPKDPEKRFRRKVGGQVGAAGRHPGRLPMPTAKAMETISAVQAAAAIDAGASANQLGGVNPFMSAAAASSAK